jgi:hypothetical protein
LGAGPTCCGTTIVWSAGATPFFQVCLQANLEVKMNCFGLPTETSGNIYNAKIRRPSSAKGCSQTFNLPTMHIVLVIKIKHFIHYKFPFGLRHGKPGYLASSSPNKKQSAGLSLQ